tara:strand:- start:5383 stop:6192 length:810 start_codon:yes stop_codon:yes gene_type:complete
MHNKDSLIQINKNIRVKILELIYHAGSGHVGPSLSIVEILSSIMLNYIDYKDYNRNRIILSKGHAVPAIYAIFDYLDMLEKDEIKTLRKFDSRLQGHPDKRKLDILDAGTGALGQGLSIAIGYSIGSQIKKTKINTFCIIGDGELQEGQIWEAAMYIGTHKLKNIITYIDGNKFQNEYSIKDTLPVKNLKEKWEGFGFDYYEIDGHDIDALIKMNEKFNSQNFANPIVVYCNTVKGKGVSYMENNNSFHHIKGLTEEKFLEALEEIKSS